MLTYLIRKDISYECKVLVGTARVTILALQIKGDIVCVCKKARAHLSVCTGSKVTPAAAGKEELAGSSSYRVPNGTTLHHQTWVAVAKDRDSHNG